MLEISFLKNFGSTCLNHYSSFKCIRLKCLTMVKTLESLAYNSILFHNLILKDRIWSISLWTINAKFQIWKIHHYISHANFGFFDQMDGWDASMMTHSYLDNVRACKWAKTWTKIRAQCKMHKICHVETVCNRSCSWYDNFLLK